jgi:signal transduction histidine kinase
MKTNKLRLLIVEDSKDDFSLLLRELNKSNYEIEYTLVDNAIGFEKALSQDWDFIISDYSLPGFTGHEALKICNEKELDTPFIMVSGTIGEDIAVNMMKLGARDYIMKNSLKRLLPAIERELEDAKTRKERKLAEAELKNSQEELKKFATHLHHIREEERIMLAREIHDELAQILIALKIDMGMMKSKLSKGLKNVDEESFVANFNEFYVKVDDSIRISRKIMSGLRSADMELNSLLDTMKQNLTDFQEKHNISCAFKTELLTINLNPKHAVTLLRIYQEALSNIVKHAKASFVSVSLEVENEKLILEIEDNGVGFDQTVKTKSDSYGVIGMKERVFIIDGKLQITSQLKTGTTVKIMIPYSESLSPHNELKLLHSSRSFD